MFCLLLAIGQAFIGHGKAFQNADIEMPFEILFGLYLTSEGKGLFFVRAEPHKTLRDPFTKEPL